MKRLSKKQQERHEELLVQLTTARDDLNQAIIHFNEEVSKLHGDLAPKVTAVNEAITLVNAFVEEIHGDQECFYDERSEKWQENDAGQAYADWMGEWEMSIDELELEEPTPFDEVEIDVETFENLSQEVSS
jgi:hypothetical protein